MHCRVHKPQVCGITQKIKQHNGPLVVHPVWTPIYASLCTSLLFPPPPYLNLQAYSLNMTYPRYMFLTYGWYEYKWFAEQLQGDECTPAQRESVLPYTLAVLQDEFLTNLSTITDIGIVSQFCYECNYSITKCVRLPITSGNQARSWMGNR